MSKIYSKTAKGLDEIKTRTAGLSQHVRQVLIFVDGKRSRDDLYGMLKAADLDEVLVALAAQGLIEATSAAAPTPAAATPATPAAPAATTAAAPAAPKPAPKAPEPVKASSEDLERRRREEEQQAELLMARSFMGRMS